MQAKPVVPAIFRLLFLFKLERFLALLHRRAGGKRFNLWWSQAPSASMRQKPARLLVVAGSICLNEAETCSFIGGRRLHLPQ
jgi:hypothetical protein